MEPADARHPLAEQAASRPVTNAHSIWELVLHISAWERACLRRLHGDRAQLTDEEDWPPISNTSQQAWEETKLTLRLGNDELRKAIAKLEDSMLDLPVMKDMSSFYVTLHGIIQHDLYHAGQIAILKKALSED